jgi:hypothetical protein
MARFAGFSIGRALFPGCSSCSMTRFGSANTSSAAATKGRSNRSRSARSQAPSPPWLSVHGPLRGAGRVREHEPQSGSAFADPAASVKTSRRPWAVSGPMAPVFRERITAALPARNELASVDAVMWEQVRNERLLTQGWNDNQTAREFFASLMGAASTSSAMRRASSRFSPPATESRWRRHRYRRQVQLFDTSRRVDPDRPHYPRQGGQWLSIVPHDLLLVFSKRPLTAGGQLSTRHALSRFV